MPKKKFILRPKLTSTVRYKVVPGYMEKDLDFKSFIDKWRKTSTVIFTKSKRICGHGIGITVKTYFLEEKSETTKSVYITCLCCFSKKEKDMFSIHLPPEGSKTDQCLEMGGVLIDTEVWKMVLLPMLGVKTKNGIKL